MIEILNPQLDSNYADYWGEPFPFQLENWHPIVKAGCYIPRWFQAPTNALQLMATGQYVDFSMQLPAGSFILAILHSFQPGSGGPSGGSNPSTGTFTVQITDVQVNHQWFSNPIPDAFFFKTSGRNGYILPKPYPVIMPGYIRTEFWCRSSGICELLFAVAVPDLKV
jgi:hypothetical protein